MKSMDMGAVLRNYIQIFIYVVLQKQQQTTMYDNPSIDATLSLKI